MIKKEIPADRCIPQIFPWKEKGVWFNPEFRYNCSIAKRVIESYHKYDYSITLLASVFMYTYTELHVP